MIHHFTKSSEPNTPKAVHHNVSYCIVLYRVVSYRIVSYRIVSYCIVLYCIVLYCIMAKPNEGPERDRRGSKYN